VQAFTWECDRPARFIVMCGTLAGRKNIFYFHGDAPSQSIPTWKLKNQPKNLKSKIQNPKSLHFAKSAAALLIIRQSAVKLRSIKIRPQRLSNVNFRISHLP